MSKTALNHHASEQVKGHTFEIRNYSAKVQNTRPQSFIDTICRRQIRYVKTGFDAIWIAHAYVGQQLLQVDLSTLQERMAHDVKSRELVMKKIKKKNQSVENALVAFVKGANSRN